VIADGFEATSQAQKHSHIRQLMTTNQLETQGATVLLASLGCVRRPASSLLASELQVRQAGRQVARCNCKRASIVPMAAQEAFYTVIGSLPHRLRVMRMYRYGLRELLNWSANRHEWFPRAQALRLEFEANKGMVRWSMAC
jgi:hypothetical protein